MAKDTQDTQDTGATATAEKVTRGPSTFVILARIVGETLWTELPVTYESITGDGAKKLAAQGIFAGADDDALKVAILEDGPGVELHAVSQRMWRAKKVKVEPQKPKLHIG